MSVLELFCDVDDFMLSFASEWKANQLATGKQRERAGQLWPSEVMTILIHFHQSHYRTFKAYYTEHVQVHLNQEFPHLVSYTRFVALIPGMLIPLLAYLQSATTLPYTQALDVVLPASTVSVAFASHQENTLDLVKTHRQMLHDLLMLASTVLVLSPYARWPISEGERSSLPLVATAIDELERMTESFWRLCANTSLDLLGNLVEHFRTIIQLLKQVQARDAVQRLCSLAGESAQILGKTLFDLHEYALAWSYYTFSLKAAQAAFNHELWAVGLGRMSLLLIYWNQPREALPLLQEAQQLTIRSARIACWLAAVRAEVYAHLGDSDSCDAALNTARTLASQASLGEDRYATGFNPSRLAGYEGACFVHLRQPDRALPALQQALALLDAQAIRRQSTLFTDMGIAYAQQGNVPTACHYAIQALAITTQTKSLSVLERVRHVRNELEAWKDTQDVKDLERQLETTSRRIAT